VPEAGLRLSPSPANLKSMSLLGRFPARKETANETKEQGLQLSNNSGCFIGRRVQGHADVR